MFSLIVTIIAIILVILLAWASVYYGGSASNTQSARAGAMQLVNGAEHLAGAALLYENEHSGALPGTLADLAPYYLSSLPVPAQAEYAAGNGTASAADWQLSADGSSLSLAKLSQSACQAVDGVYGLSTIPAALDTTHLVQCYGTAEPYTFYYSVNAGQSGGASPASAGPLSFGAITPIYGDSNGGTPITISGNGFQSGATVNIGGSDATSISVVNAQTITALAPLGWGIADVVITNPDGSTVTGAGAFYYLAYAAWAAESGMGFTRSADNLTEQFNSNVCSAPPCSGFIATTNQTSTGKWYWEYHIDSAASASAITAGVSGTNSTMLPVSVGDTISILLDRTGNTVTAWRNCASVGVINPNPNADTYTEAQVNFSASGQVTGNFGQHPFTCNVPTGYNAGLWQQTW